MWLIVGLGNPGLKYDKTRHNLGFCVVNELARRYSNSFKKSWRVKGQLCEIDIDNQAALLVKPHTFMNRSGIAVSRLMRKKGLKPENLIVIIDDIELLFGRLRVRSQGGTGGHNGLKSLIDCLGTKQFVRLRVGVGPCPPERDKADFVLSNFTKGEQSELDNVISNSIDAVLGIVNNGVEKTMRDFN